MDALPNAKVRPGTTALKVDEAVGVQKRLWFVAIVNNKSELYCKKRLEQLGFECYVPTQVETRCWRNGVKNIVERVLFPSHIFIYATEKERKQQIVNISFIKRFLTNTAGKMDSFGKHPIAVIPDEQILSLKFILEHGEVPVEIEQTSFMLGDKVRIVRGKLTGIEGHIIECGKSTCFAIRIDCLGVAKVKIEKEKLELAK